MVDNNQAYTHDQSFWDIYLKGRPHLPDSFFERIKSYHNAHGGRFAVAHDVGAGIGIHSDRLAQYFNHVVVSDVSAQNIEMARQRLTSTSTSSETTKYKFRTSVVENAADLKDGTVDLVFAAMMMHFVDDFDLAFSAIAKQLAPGGTFVCYGFGAPRFPSNRRIEEPWREMFFHTNHLQINYAKDRRTRLRTRFISTSGYDRMSVPERYFRSGTLRLRLNQETEGWPPMLPEDLQTEAEKEFGKDDAIGANDEIVYEDQPGWDFEATVTDLRDQINSYPFVDREPERFQPYWDEVQAIMGDSTIKGYWPAKVILATVR